MPSPAPDQKPQGNVVRALTYSVAFDQALGLWVAEARAKNTILRGIGDSKAQAMAVLWRSVNKRSQR